MLALKHEGYAKWSFSIRDTVDTFSYGGFWKLPRKYFKTGMGEFYRSLNQQAFVAALQKLMPELTVKDLLRPAGPAYGRRHSAPKGSCWTFFPFFKLKRWSTF